MSGALREILKKILDDTTDEGCMTAIGGYLFDYDKAEKYILELIKEKLTTYRVDKNVISNIMGELK